MLGLIAEYEEREAARESGYRWSDWEPLLSDEKAAVIAHYRLRHLIESNVRDAVESDRERRSRLKAQKKGR